MNIKGMFKIASLFTLGISLSACQGQLSEKSPIHPNPNMDQQARKEAQEENKFFEDGRSMRQPVEGTVARGFEKADDAYYRGVDANGDFIDYIPVDLTRSFLYRGKERYEIYCTPCHGQDGTGDGIIMEGNYGYVPAPSYHQKRLIDAPDGQIYSAIYDGVRTMPSYAHQIPTKDRWAIVAYVRALQESQNLNEEEMKAYPVDLAELRSEFKGDKAQEDSAAAANAPKNTPEPSVSIGKDVIAANGCAACHNETGAEGGIGPTWAGLFGHEVEVITESGETKTITADEDYIHESIVKPEANKPVDYKNGVMPPFGYLEDYKVQSIVLYIKNLSDN